MLRRRNDDQVLTWQQVLSKKKCSTEIPENEPIVIFGEKI
jgi:hypothetical protein